MAENMMNSAHKTSNDLFRSGWERTFIKKKKKIKKMKVNWSCLEEGKCPTIGCKTKGRKTALILLKKDPSTFTFTCPKCEGEWVHVIFSPMGMSWIQTKEPIGWEYD